MDKGIGRSFAPPHGICGTHERCCTIRHSHGASLKSTAIIVVLIVLFGGFARGDSDKCFSISQASIEKQQRRLSNQVTILLNNFGTWWLEAYPKGAPFVTRDNADDRRAAWRPKFDPPKDAAYLNDGLGCVTFITKNNAPTIPDICAPADVQARLAMEALREDWDKSRNAVGQNKMLDMMRDGIPIAFYEEKTMYCVLRPEAQYIDLTDKLESCTPN